MKKILELFQTIRDRYMTLRIGDTSAELSFRAMVALAPSLTLVVPLVSGVFRDRDITGALTNFFSERFGESGASLITALSASDPWDAAGVAIMVFNVAVSLSAAYFLFLALARVMGSIFERPAKQSVFGYVEALLLTIVSLAIIASMPVVSIFSRDIVVRVALGSAYGASVVWLHVINTAIVGAVLFGVLVLLYRTFADASRVTNRSVLLGALLGSSLYVALGALVSMYSSIVTTVSLYGPASFLLVLLAWFYYGANAICMGALLASVLDQKPA